MHVEFILAAIVLVVAILVGADYFRRTGDNPQEYAPQEYAPQEYPGNPAHDAGQETATAPRAGSAPSPSAFEAARAGPGADSRPHQEARYQGPRNQGTLYQSNL